MALSLNGSTGVSGVDGSAGTPAVQGADSNTGISFGTDEVSINTGGTTQVKVDSSGRVGIGTTSPARKLEIATGDIRLTDGYTLEWGAAGNYIYGNSASNFLAAVTSSSERARIDSSGRLLVGTSTNLFGGFRFQVSSGSNTALFHTTSSGNDAVGVWSATNSGNNVFASFYTETGVTTRGSITFNRGGGLVAYNTTSDYRAKTLLGDLENSGQTIDALRVYRGVMNGATIERPMLVAHEAQEVAPYCVTGEKDAVDDDGNPIYQQMDHQALVPLLIAEIQQLRSRVATLEGA